MSLCLNVLKISAKSARSDGENPLLQALFRLVKGKPRG